MNMQKITHYNLITKLGTILLGSGNVRFYEYLRIQKSV